VTLARQQEYLASANRTPMSDAGFFDYVAVVASQNSVP
jgi:hypothetical protein